MADEAYRISLHPNSTDELGQHVERDFDASHGFYNADRDAVNINQYQVRYSSATSSSKTFFD